MTESLEDHYKSNQKYLKLEHQESFIGTYIGWRSIEGKFGKAYRFTLERPDGSRIDWDTSNNRAVIQMFPFKKGDPIKIYCEFVKGDDGKDRRQFKITKNVYEENEKDEQVPF